MNVRTQNILTVAVAIVFFGSFVILAEGIGGDDHRRLDASATTTTAVTLPRVTTSQPPTTLVVVPSTVVTVAPSITPTTVRTTVTTRRTTATTQRRTSTTRSSSGTTATTVAAGPNGPATEASDNSAAFVHNSDGSTSESATPVPANAGALVFKITAQVLSASGTSAQVRFTVEITNQRGRRITFPGGMKVTLQITPSNGSPFNLVMDAHEVAGLDNGEKVTAGTTAPVEGYGSFTVNGSVDVDYGS